MRDLSVEGRGREYARWELDDVWRGADEVLAMVTDWCVVVAVGVLV